MLLTLIGFIVGFSISKGSSHSYRIWKMLGIILGMAFFLGLIFTLIPQFKTIILPVGTIEIMNLIYPQAYLLSETIMTGLFSVVMTFFWFLVGKGMKWLITRRGL